MPGYDTDNTELNVRAGSLQYSNGSFRTRLSVDNLQGYVLTGITVRDNQVGPDDTDASVFGTNLLAAVSNDGLNGFGGMLAEGTVSTSGWTPISLGQGVPVGETDVLFQFDVFGDSAELTIWSEDEKQPEPQWAGEIDELYTKTVFFNLFIYLPRMDVDKVQTRFRYVAVLPTASSPTMPGDFDEDFRLTAADVDLLAAALRNPTVDLKFDANYDQSLNEADHTAWVRALAHTWFGDANLDRMFNSEDLVLVFGAGQFEDQIPNNSTWATGDWNGDGEFTTTDLVRAFQDGGYEQGVRPAVAAVPEPGSSASGLWVSGALLTLIRRRTR